MSRVKHVAKLAASSRTNRTVAVMVGVATATMLAKHAGFDLEARLAEYGVAIEDVMGLATACAGALAIMYRERGRHGDAIKRAAKAAPPAEPL